MIPNHFPATLWGGRRASGNSRAGAQHGFQAQDRHDDKYGVFFHFLLSFLNGIVKGKGQPPVLLNSDHPDATAGILTVKVLPWPGLLSTVMAPWWASTMNLAMLRPRPQPSARRVRLRST